jgi:RNA polymerase sigma-70 factor (ECF subfamily)
MEIEQIYSEYFDKIYKYVFWKVNHIQITQDIVSDVFYKVIDKQPELSKVKNLNAWIFRIATNAVYDYYRSVKSESLDDSITANKDEDSKDVLTQVQQDEEYQKLRVSIQSLPDKQRDTVLLKFFSDLKNKDIASLLKVSEKTVSANLSQAYDKLEKSLLLN